MSIVAFFVLQFLLSVSEQYGDCYLTHIMLPIFLISVGDNADLTYFPTNIQSKVEGSAFVFVFFAIVSDSVGIP